MIGNVLRVRYELTQLITENALFQSFVALDKLQSREVCVRLVKEPFSKEEEFVETLQEVVRRVAAVRQPAIEELYEVDSDESSLFIVGQLTKGSSIGERLRKLATFSVPATVEVGISLCEGLRALHRATIAHGDISSANVAIQPDGETRLQNAGLWQAFYVDPKGREAMLTASATYTAPEVSKGGLPTPASDMYSVGVLLYELLTGRPPYHGDSALAMALQHATEPVPSVRQTTVSVPQVLDHMLRKAMAKQPGDRYRDGEEMLSDLRMLQDALRFGRSLNWPLNPETPAAASTPTPTAPAAPAAATPAPKPEPKPKKVRQDVEDDAALPAWLKIISVFVLGVVITIALLFFYTNFQKPTMVKVPKLANMSFDKGDQLLKSLGLHLVRFRATPSEKIPADTILSTNPAPGATVYQGDDVKAILSSGSRFVEVPDLRGMTLDQAKGALNKVGLQLDNQPEQVPSKDLAQGLIVSQTQQPNGKYERGTLVHVRVSSGKSNVETEDPDANTRYDYTLRFQILDEKAPIQLKVDMTDARGTRTVWDQKQNPNDEVTIPATGYGSKATFRYFYNGDLVKQETYNGKDLADSGDQGGDSSDQGQ